jgi:hypothetical protein
MKVQRTEIFCVEKMGMFRCAAPYAKFRWITYKYWAALPVRSGRSAADEFHIPNIFLVCKCKPASLHLTQHYIRKILVND